MLLLLILTVLSVALSLSVTSIVIGIHYKNLKEFKEVTSLSKFLAFLGICVFIYPIFNFIYHKQTLSLHLILIFSLTLLFLSLRYEKREKEKSKRNFQIKILRDELVPIEKHLRKEEQREEPIITFSRIGPTWYNFENCNVVEREEVKDIVKKIKNGRAFLHGPPGKGKSVILNWVGYQLNQEGNNVFVLPFKEMIPHWDKEKLNKICASLEETRSFLLLDDVHLDTGNISEQFYKQLSKRILFAGRTPEKAKVKDKAETSALDQEFLNTKPIEIEMDLAEKVINLFEEIKQKSIPDFAMSAEIKETLKEDYKSNLRLLALQLYAHRDDTQNINELKDIKEGIRRYIREELKISGAEDILLPISLLYQYEIPIRKPFITELLGQGYEDQIKELCRKIEIFEVNDMKKGWDNLRMHHSEDAKIYAQAFESYKDLGAMAKAKLEKSIDNYPALTWKEKFYLSYLSKFPSEGMQLIIKLNREIMQKIETYHTFEEILVKIIEAMDNFDWKKYFYFSYKPEKNVLKTFRKIVPEVFKEKITRWDDPGNITYLIETLHEVAYVHFQKIKEIKPQVFEEKINKWNDPAQIAWLIGILNKVGYAHLQKIIEIKSEIFEEKINKWDNLGSIAQLIGTLHEVGYVYFQKIREIEPQVFEEKITRWDDTWDITYLTETLHEIGYEISRLSFKEFEEKINKWGNPELIAKLIGTLHKIGYAHFQKINEIKPEIFEEKIIKWDNPGDIARLIGTLHEVGYSQFEKIIEIKPRIFEEKITNCDYPGIIDWLIGTLHEVGYVINRLSPEVFENKIIKWDNPGHSAALIKALHKVEYDHFKRINEIVPQVFEDKINKWDNPGDIARLIRTLYEVEYVYLQKIIQIKPRVFEEKINKWEHPVNIAQLIRTLHKVGYAHLQKIIEIKYEIFEEKIKKWDNPGDIARLIGPLHEVGYVYFQKIKEIKPQIFESKITKWDDPGDIAYLIETLHVVGYEQVDQLINTLPKEKKKEVKKVLDLIKRYWA